MLNKIMMTGRITTDLTVVTENNHSYCKFGIAVDQPKQNDIATVETDTLQNVKTGGMSESSSLNMPITAKHSITMFMARPTKKPKTRC